MSTIALDRKLLVIDDDVELCQLLDEYLSAEHFEVDCVHDGEEGLAQLKRRKYSLVVLDVMLPGINGFEALRQIRSESEIPVMMLTARGDEVDRIVGLEIGADDYLPKPFNPRELVARIHAILRRATPLPSGRDGTTLEVGDVRLEPSTRTVVQGDRIVELTSLEFDLLEALLRSAGTVCTRTHLSQKVLQREFSPFDRSLDVHISQLRKKLGTKAAGRERIKTLRGIGYMYALDNAAREGLDPASAESGP